MTADLSRVAVSRGATTAEKWRGPRFGSPPPAVRVRWYHPRKIVENSDAKSCFCAQLRPQSWGINTLLVPPTETFGGTSLPQSPRLLRLCQADHQMWTLRDQRGSNQVYIALAILFVLILVHFCLQLSRESLYGSQGRR